MPGTSWVLVGRPGVLETDVGFGVGAGVENRLPAGTGVGGVGVIGIVEAGGIPCRVGEPIPLPDQHLIGARQVTAVVILGVGLGELDVDIIPGGKPIAATIAFFYGHLDDNALVAQSTCVYAVPGDEELPPPGADPLLKLGLAVGSESRNRDQLTKSLRIGQLLRGAAGPQDAAGQLAHVCVEIAAKVVVPVVHAEIPEVLGHGRQGVRKIGRPGWVFHR